MDASPRLMAPTQKEELARYKGLGSSQTHNSGYRRIIGTRSGVESLERSLLGGGSGIQPIAETGILVCLG